MASSLPTVQPGYFARFQCRGADCEDTCCVGWGVVIDRATYRKYQAWADPEWQSHFALRLTVNPSAPSAAAYAHVALDHATCPFLSKQRLCAIQAKFGAEQLSRTCALYPRALNVVNGTLERSLSPSCPEAARLALLDPEPMAFVAHGPDGGTCLGDAPRLDTDTALGARRHFAAIREFTLSLLQDRSYLLWERLVILGLFCDQLQQLEAQGDGDAAPALIASYSHHRNARLFASDLAGITVQPSVQLDLLAQAIGYRLGMDHTGERFLACYREYRQGIGDTGRATPAQISARYAEAYVCHYRPFMDGHAHILENYVVNAAFQTLFPFGPDTGLYATRRDIPTHFLLLAVHYALVRTLLVGVAGCYESDFSAAHAVRVIQSYAKTVQHNLPYLDTLLRSLEDSRMTGMAVLAALLKN